MLPTVSIFITLYLYVSLFSFLKSISLSPSFLQFYSFPTTSVATSTLPACISLYKRFFYKIQHPIKVQIYALAYARVRKQCAVSIPSLYQSISPSAYLFLCLLICLLVYPYLVLSMSRYEVNISDSLYHTFTQLTPSAYSISHISQYHYRKQFWPSH